ncbi:unnamed protein product, partial [Pylaiella littoralis]
MIYAGSEKRRLNSCCVPKELGNLVALVELDLRYNQLS